MKLMSMIAYVDSKEETPTFDTPQIDWYNKEIDKLYQIRKYSNFLKQPLKLEMFTPCNEQNKPLKEPSWWYRYQNGASPFMNMDEIRPCQEYKKALENVLFEGFVFYKDDNESFSMDLINSDGSETFCFMKNETIEDLLTFDFEFTLTEKALKP